MTRRDWLATPLLAVGTSLGCREELPRSASRAMEHAASLQRVVERDVEQVRDGLPEGARLLAAGWPGDEQAQPSAATVRRQLLNARRRIKLLRVAKSTFFGLALPDGQIAASTAQPDRLAGESLFRHFPETSGALRGDFTTVSGAFPPGHGVRGKADGVWLAACPVRSASVPVAIYFTGWSWSQFAGHLQFVLRGELKTQARSNRASLPLTYVYIASSNQVYGAPDAPEVNAQAIAALVKRRATGTPDERGLKAWKATLRVEGRGFGLGVDPAPALGSGLAVAVLRSET